MKRGFLICIGIIAIAVTADAQMRYNPPHKKALQTTTTNRAYRSIGRQATPQRRFSSPRFRQPSLSMARPRESRFRTTRIQPSTSTSFGHRATTFRSAAAPRTTNRQSEINDLLTRPRTRLAAANDLREPRLRERPRVGSSLVNRPAINDSPARRDTRLQSADDWRESKFREQRRTSSSLLKPFTMNDTAALRPPRAEFNNRWATTYLRGQMRSSFVNRSGPATAPIPEQGRAAFSNNWRGDRFTGRRYWTFRNYQPQWHDSSWWNDHCERIVFVTVSSQQFPFYFDAGYWYPAWGYYTDAYYPYDGPIYGYNDLPPDEIIANVQIELYNQGYYSGPIDGILGPDTQAAIADYQADQGLAVTAAIDEPTIESLGLV